MDQCITIKDKQFKLYIKQDKINEAVKKIAGLINKELASELPVFLAVLNGSFIFAADLLREVTIPCEVSFIKVASYNGTGTTGNVKELIGLSGDLSGRTVVILEDIVDSGTTLEKLSSLLYEKKVKEVRIATALFKPGSYKKPMAVNYIGLSIPDDFVVGYGMDYNGHGRNLKDIYILA